MLEIREFIDSVENIILNLSEKLKFPDGFAMFIKNNNKNKKDDYSLWLVEPVSNKNAKLILTIAEKGRKGQEYLRIGVKKDKPKEIGISHDIEVKTIASDKLNCYLDFTEITTPILDFVTKLIIYYVEHFEPSEKFGCCHRYKECSDAKKCLHPDLFYSRACWYRKNLENGNIFY